MRRLAQSTSFVVMLKLFLSSDHVSAATGKTVAIKISKAGGAFGDPNAGATNATEVSNGWYKVTLDVTDTNTLGDLVVRGTAAACDDSEQISQVVSATNGGASNLDATVTSRSSHSAADVWGVATRLLTAGTNIALAKGTGITGFNDLDAAGVRGALGLAAANADTQFAAIKAKTDNLPASPAAVGSAMTLTGGERTAIANEVEAQIIDDTDSEQVLTAITNKIASVNPSLSGLTLAAIGSQVRTELTTELGRIDAPVSSRSSHSAADVWASATRLLTAGTNIALAKGTGITGFNDLDAAGVRGALGLAAANVDTQFAAIKAKTDNLPASPAAVGDIPSAVAIAAAVGAAEVEPGLSRVGQERITMAVLAGKASGFESGIVRFRNIADDRDRVVANVSGSGNRMGVVLDAG
jgi:predicted Fe-Mo cluster-binding NifX family protein